MKLPSGAELRVTLSPFATGRALYQAVCEELKTLKFDPTAQVDVNFRKDVFCTLLSSKAIETCIWDCMKKSLYNNLPITEDTFEPELARQDYIPVLMEVGTVNILPFTKNLSAELSVILAALSSNPV